MAKRSANDSGRALREEPAGTGNHLIPESDPPLQQQLQLMAEANARLEAAVAELTAELHDANERLAREVVAREQAEKRLIAAHSRTEDGVSERTSQLEAEVRARVEAETRLRESGERLRLAISGARLGTWHWDLRADILVWSDACLAMFGLPPGTEVTYEVFLAAVHPEDREAVSNAVRVALDCRTEYDVEMRTVWPDGTERWISSRGRGFYDSEGPTRMEGVVLDITDHKRAEREVRQSRDLLELFVEHAPASLAMFDREMRYLRASQRWCRDYHLEYGATLGKCHYDVFPTIPERWKEAHRSGLRGEVIKCEEDSFEGLDGKRIWVRWEIHPWSEPGRAEPAGIIIFTEDITERKRYEAALHRSDEALRSFVENSPFGIYRTSEKSACFTIVNRSLAAMLGYDSESDLLNVSLRDLYADPNGRAHFLERIPASGYFRDVEVKWRRKDGKTVVVGLNGRCIEGDEEEGRIIEGFVQDLTEHRALEEQFRQAQKMEAIGRLAGGVAHDFNNLLGVILGYTDIIASHLPPESLLQTKLDSIRQAGLRGASLTSQLLAFSRRQVLQPRIVNLNAVVAETEMMLQRLIREDIVLHLVLQPDLAHVQADPAQVVQILMNLAVNARDAMPNGGSLNIATEMIRIASDSQEFDNVPPGEYVCLRVSDTGTGMDLETQKMIFEPFFTTKNPGQGTGLGLATVYGIVQQSGGFIHVRSQVDTGTTFSIFLPRVQTPLENLAHEPAPAQLPVSGTVLLVEDDPVLRELIAAGLEAAGYRLLIAADTADALRIAEGDPDRIDLLLTDIVMPGIRGNVLAERITALRPSIKTLLMSGYAEDVFGAAGALEAHAFLQKPFRLEDLVQKIQSMWTEKDPGIPKVD